MSDDFYSLLGIAKTASMAEIKKAYLQMARDNHPDRFTDPAERQEADRQYEKPIAQHLFPLEKRHLR